MKNKLLISNQLSLKNDTPPPPHTRLGELFRGGKS